MITSLARLTAAGMVLTAVSSFAATLYVDVNSTNPVPPYTNWATAANVIQDAVDAATNGDTVLVTDGVYDTGGKAVYGTTTNRVAVDKPLTLMSVNGPGGTVIKGYQVPGTTNGDRAVRCVYLTNGASLVGFTVTDGATADGPAPAGGPIYRGGGVRGESISSLVSECVISGNAAYEAGGGIYSCTLNSCALSNNYSVFNGGGAAFSTANDSLFMDNAAGNAGGGVASGLLNNCAVVGNSAQVGGGTWVSSFTNCTLIGNSVWGAAGPGNVRNSILYLNAGNYIGLGGFQIFTHCCTTPDPGGPDNITNAPLFVDTNGWADLRLQSNSPCINAGHNAYVTTTNDLDGNPRIQGATVDVGAYEFQSPQSTISYAYLQQHGLPTDGSADGLDVDGDKATTWQEWKMWTDPTNQLSVLRLLTPQPRTNGTLISWQSVSGQRYLLERGTNPATGFTPVQSNILGQASTTIFTDTTATNGDAFLYRVGVPE